MATTEQTYETEQQQETTSTMSASVPEETTTHTPVPGVPNLRVVALDRIQVRDGFNPRTRRDEERFGRTAFSIAQDGVLAPVLVTPTAPDAETFWLVAGEGRYRAAEQAGQTTIPVLVRKVDERTNGLELALAENLAREDLDPVAIAHGFDRLKRAGWGRRQIAEQFSVTQKLVADRLQILKIPDGLHPLIATGEIPLSAVKPLARLAQAHPELPAVLVARVRKGKPAQSWVEPLDWSTAVEDPIGALTLDYQGPGTRLPAGVYDPNESLDPKDLPLPEQARKQLRELAQLRRVDPDKAEVRLTREGLEHARSLGAVVSHPRGFSHLLIGEDILVQVLTDQTKAAVKHARKVAERQRDAAAKRDAAHADATGAQARNDGSLERPAPSPEEQAEQRRRERQQELEARRKSRVHNEELGAAVLRSLVRLKLDERSLKVLLATIPLLDLPGLAMRGARYCLPGWATEESTKTGKTKVTYPDIGESRRKAIEFLDGATTVGEITGRLFSLIALARYADEHAVARSRRSTYRFPRLEHTPWEQETVDLIDEICADRLPEHLTAPVREERRAFLATQERGRRERREAAQRVKAALEQVGELSKDERTQVVEDAKRAWGPWDPKVWDVRRKLRENELKTTDPDAAAANARDMTTTSTVDAGDGESREGSSEEHWDRSGEESQAA